MPIEPAWEKSRVVTTVESAGVRVAIPVAPGALTMLAAAAISTSPEVARTVPRGRSPAGCATATPRLPSESSRVEAATTTARNTRN